MAADLKDLADNFLEDQPAWDSSVFLGAVRELVDQEETRVVLELFQNEKYKALAEVVAWDILPIVTPHVSDTERNDEVYKDCLQILNTLAEIGKPKELIFGILEQLDRFLDDTSYRTLLKPLSTVLMRFGLTKSYQMNQALILLHTHLQTTKFPSGDGLDEKQRRLLLEDPSVVRLGGNTVAVLDFLGPFVFQVEQMLFGNVKELSELERTEVVNTRTEITKLLIRMLDYPISRADLSWNDTEDDSDMPRHKSDFRLASEQALTYLKRMRVNFSELMFYAKEFNLPVAPSPNTDDDLGEEDHGPGNLKGLPPRGFGCLLYLVLVENIQDDQIPSVYSASYLLDLSSVYIAALLRKAQEEPVQKGLMLLSELVEGIEECSLHHSLLSNSFYEDLPQMLSVVMVMSPLSIIRQAAHKVFPTYIHKFDWKGRYRLLRVLLQNTIHSGVCGMVIGIIKDYIIHTLQHHNNDWFIGQRLTDLYQLIFILPNGPESDMLEASDKVMAALNCMRFLLLRDPKEVNETGIWGCIDDIEAQFLTPLHKGLTLSLAHYQQRIAALLEEHKGKGKGKPKPPTTSLTVAGHQLPMMPPGQQMQVLRSACATHELMQSIVGRVRDIVSTNQRQGQGSEVMSDGAS